MRRPLILLAHAVTGWALCFATIGIGMAVTTERTALIVHVIGTPAAFTGFVIVVDFLLVGLLILGDLEMFTSLLGIWIPFVLIFTVTWLTGHLIARRTGHRRPAWQRVTSGPDGGVLGERV